jgi:hypothetical protein
VLGVPFLTLLARWAGSAEEWTASSPHCLFVLFSCQFGYLRAKELTVSFADDLLRGETVETFHTIVPVEIAKLPLRLLDKYSYRKTSRNLSQAREKLPGALARTHNEQSVLVRKPDVLRFPPGKGCALQASDLNGSRREVPVITMTCANELRHRRGGDLLFFDSGFRRGEKEANFSRREVREDSRGF